MERIQRQHQAHPASLLLVRAAPWPGVGGVHEGPSVGNAQSFLRARVVHSWSTLPVLWSFLVLVDVLAKGVPWVPWVELVWGFSFIQHPTGKPAQSLFLAVKTVEWTWTSSLPCFSCCLCPLSTQSLKPVCVNYLVSLPSLSPPQPRHPSPGLHQNNTLQYSSVALLAPRVVTPHVDQLGAPRMMSCPQRAPLKLSTLY